MPKKSNILIFVEFILLIQFLVIAVWQIRENTKLVFIDFSITSMYSLFFIIRVLIEKMRVTKKLLLISIVFGFAFLVYFNVERIYYSNYYLILFENQNELKDYLANNNKGGVSEFDGVKTFWSSEDIMFLYYLDNHPCFEGIAYSETQNKPTHTGQMLQQIIHWGKLYGNWYYWSAVDPY